MRLSPILTGTDAYRGMILDAGISRRLGKRFELDGGIYLFRERSVLLVP